MISNDVDPFLYWRAFEESNPEVFNLFADSCALYIGSSVNLVFFPFNSVFLNQKNAAKKTIENILESANVKLLPDFSIGKMAYEVTGYIYTHRK